MKGDLIVACGINNPTMVAFYLQETDHLTVAVLKCLSGQIQLIWFVILVNCCAQ
jgi:hypothetical protein